MRYTFLFLIIFLGFSSCSKKTSSSKTVVKTQYQFDFEENQLLADVLDKAKAEDKLVYVDMSASWCVPCKVMKKEVYTHKRTADFFNENFISQITDVEVGEGPDLGVIFGVNVVPTLLFLDHRGRVVVKYEGSTSASNLVALGEEAMEKAGK